MKVVDEIGEVREVNKVHIGIQSINILGVKPCSLVWPALLWSCLFTLSSLRNCDLYRMSLRATLLGLLDSSRSSEGRGEGKEEERGRREGGGEGEERKMREGRRGERKEAIEEEGKEERRRRRGSWRRGWERRRMV